MTPATAATAVYLRISSDPHGLRAGVERQRADCLAIVEARGWPAPTIYEDNDVSAWKGKRPAFEAMLLDIQARRVKAVVAWDMDRLVRQVRDLERFLDTCDTAKVTKVVTAQGDIDLTASDGRLYARIMASMATKESDDKSRRVRRALMDKGERGLWRGGRPPFGYRAAGDTLTLVPEEADIVRRAAVAVAEGASIRSVMRLGGPGTHQGWRALLLSPTIAGITHTGHRAQWEPIIPGTVAGALREQLADPKRKYHHGTDRVHWLSGLAACGLCEGPLRHQARTRKGVDYSRWVCVAKGCRGISIVAGAFEEFVFGALLAAAPTVGAPTTPEPIPPKGDGVPLGGPDLRDIMAMYATGKITRDEWEAAREALLRTQEPSTAPPPDHVPITERAWDAWTPEEQRRAAGHLLRRVIVLPATVGVLSERVEFTWVR